MVDRGLVRGGDGGSGSGDAGAVLSSSWGDPQNPLEPANTNEVQGGKVIEAGTFATGKGSVSTIDVTEAYLARILQDYRAGKPLAVVEFGRFENRSKPETMVKDLLDTEQYLRQEGFFMFMYWHGLSKENSKGEIWDYRLKSTQTKEAMKQISSRGRKGW